MTGTLTILSVEAADRTGLGTLAPAGQCFVGPGFEDVSTGTAVTIRDGTGMIIATSVLEPFRLVDVRTDTMSDMSAPWDPDDPLNSDYPIVNVTLGHCEFPFTAQVPEVDFYSIEVAQRGTVNYSKAQMAESGWAVHVSL